MLPVRGKSSENVSWCDFIALWRSCNAGVPEKRGLLRVRFAPVSRPLSKPIQLSLQCQLPTSADPPLTAAVEPSQSWNLSVGFNVGGLLYLDGRAFQQPLKPRSFSVSGDAPSAENRRPLNRRPRAGELAASRTALRMIRRAGGWRAMGLFRQFFCRPRPADDPDAALLGVALGVTALARSRHRVGKYGELTLLRSATDIPTP
jgi:hypothetical protein